MHLHINHMFCTETSAGGSYDCRYMVTISKYLGLGENRILNIDWNPLLRECSFQNYNEESGITFMATTNRLRIEILVWLKAFIRDGKFGSGFAIGSDRYNSRDMLSFNIFFYRRNDAMRFIKRWSSYKLPTTYFDYFKDEMRQLNFETKKLEKVQIFTL